MKSKTKVTLTVAEGFGQGETFEFTEQDNFLLGRDAEGSHAHFRLSPKDTFVSRNHFLLEINPPDCYLRDAGSLNGTFIVKKGENPVVLFLEGREERREWDAMAEQLRGQFQCDSYQKGEVWIKLSTGDHINVGDTLIAINISHEIPEISRKSVQQNEPLHCIQCGKDITGEIQEKKAEKLESSDFLCQECQAKQKKSKEPLPKEEVKCWGCGKKDLTALAITDGKASELRDIALYWCEDCASSRQESVPIPEIENYRILKELGSGGFGVVYLAWDKNTARIVALKLTREKIKQNERLLQYFKREITIMKELGHSRLVRLYDEGVSEGENYYFVSEYLPQGSLGDLLEKKKGGKMPYGKACYFISQALDGLSYFHNFYVHRDLKPENIFLRKDEKGNYLAKIGDFGLAKSYILHGGTITKLGERAGSPYYMPPEQISNFKNVKPVTDVYAMGMTLYHLITGEFPYYFPSRKEQREMISKGEKPRDYIDIILGNDKPTPIEKKVKDIPKNFAKAINKVIDKDASKRFDSADKFKNAIERYAICE